MNLKYLILGTALLVPMALLSCDDSKVPTEAAVEDPSTQVDMPSLTTVGFGSKWHDPHIKGPKVRTFTNENLGELVPASAPCDADEKRFGSQDGAELRVSISFTELIAPTQFTAIEDLCNAGVYPVDQKIRGKKVSQVKELDYSYAGGGHLGAPSMRIPIDECLEVAPNHSTSTTRQPCGNISYQFTDGIMEQYAYIDAETCHDGDANVGVIEGEDADECLVRYGSSTYPNWDAFVEDHGDDRIAKKAYDHSVATTVIEERPLVDARTSVFIGPFRNIEPNVELESLNSHYLVWMVDVR